MSSTLENYDHAVITAHEEEAERIILGAMMMSRQAVLDVTAIIKPSQLYVPRHQAIMAAILQLDEEDGPRDPAAVAYELEKAGELTRVGGLPYLHTLLASTHTATNADYFAGQIQEAANRRAAHRLAARIASIASTVDDRVAGAIDEALDTYYTEVSAAVDECRPIGDDLDDWLADQINHVEPPGLSTGLIDLDEYTQLRPGELIVVAARPGIGKTTLGLGFCDTTAIEQGIPTILFSLEMTRREILDRLVARRTRTEFELIRDHKLTDSDLLRIKPELPRIRRAPLRVEDASEIGVDEIRAAAREWHRQHVLPTGGHGLIVIDYLQLVRPRLQRREVNREQEVADMSRALKVLAKELGVPVVLIAQLNRESTKRAGGVPQENDLRESGSIEANANTILLLHRPSYQATPAEIMKDPDLRPGEVAVIIAKQRGGKTGTVWCSWKGGYQSIANLTHFSAPH